MARKTYINNRIHRNDIFEIIKKIPMSKCEYITPSGIVYTQLDDDYFFKKRTFVNKHNGYLYVNFISLYGYAIQRRVHILVAEAFLEQPHSNEKLIVMHKDNNKQNPHVDNLMWGTISQNTKSAYDDGLCKNDKGFDDSQSKSICVFDANGNYIECCGSIGECSKKYDVTKGCISYQCRHEMKSTNSRCGFFFRFKSEYDIHGFIL